MKSNNIAVIVPVEADADRSTLPEMVWSKTTELLLPQLGNMYSRFEPASGAGRQAVERPYGVLLGKDDPALFLYFYAIAKARQAEAIEFHVKKFMDKVKPLDKHETDKLAIVSMFIDGSDEETMAHLAWHMGMIEGRLFPDCGLYFLGQKETFASDKLENEVLGNLPKYALCLVTLAMEEENG